MHNIYSLFVVFTLSLSPNFSLAAEGTSIAGISGGSDMRSAHHPPSGLYVAGVTALGKSTNFYDGNGHKVPLFNDLEIVGRKGALALLYVPDFKLAGGSFGLLGALTYGSECGRLFGSLPSRCTTGWGDPYIEASWSRFFGTIRPSQYANAFPIKEGLAIKLGMGVVIPAGSYNVLEAKTSGIAIGNNVWDIAPMVALTYTSPPLLAEGTEISGKLFWNNYRKNSATHYLQGDLLSVDFALTERIGRFQFGIAGLFAQQIEDDRLSGVPVSPDGRRVKSLSLGPIIAIDLPEYGSSLKIKAQKSIIKQNSAEGIGILVTFATKIH